MTAFFYTYFDKPLESAKFHFFVNQLPKDTINRIQRYQKWQDAHACLFGRLLLRRMLSSFSIGQNLDSLKYTNYQKPYFENSDFNFNISHSGKYVVCAGSNQSVLGVDIEKIKPINMLDFKDQFHDEEWTQINNSVSSLASFYDLWTRKEAIIKGDGKGLNVPLHDLNLFENRDRVRIDQTVWSLQEVYIDKKYKCHLAYQGEPESILYRKFMFLRN